MNIGPTELLVILVIALIVFGPRKLPELGKSIGQAMAQFRRASDDFKRSWEQEVELEKARLNEIKSELEVPAVSDPYSYEPGDYETGSETESAVESKSETEPGSEAESEKPAVVASGSEPSRSEHWI